MERDEYTRKALKELPSKAKKMGPDTKKYFVRLRAKNPRKLDFRFQDVHDEVFEKYDCLSCGNCCKTISPLFLVRDIERISKYMTIHPKTFKSQFLDLDEDDDLVLKKLPCRFLDEQNYCSIYEDRPKSCDEYPHTDSKHMRSNLRITHENSFICPAVFEIIEEIKNIFPV